MFRTRKQSARVDLTSRVEPRCRAVWGQDPHQTIEVLGKVAAELILPRRDGLPVSPSGRRVGTAPVALSAGAGYRPNVFICASVQWTRVPGDQIAHYWQMGEWRLLSPLWWGNTSPPRNVPADSLCRLDGANPAKSRYELRPFIICFQTTSKLPIS